jgi:hypothetical protein|tara:strand:+ start:699 stop:974 length:276 start_codon:yes stop_codon:yes gene_type:complete
MSTIYNYTGGQLVSVKELTKLPQYAWLTEASLRHYIFQSESRFASDGTKIPGNGLARAILRVGRKVLIDLDEFNLWVESHRMEPSPEGEDL